MSDAHESDLPIEIQFQTVPPADTAASACFVDTGIESRLVSLIVAVQLQIDLQTQT